MNFLKEKYKNYEDGLKDFLSQKQSMERDCGNHLPPTKEDTERWTNTFQYFWNLEELESLPGLVI